MWYSDDFFRWMNLIMASLLPCVLIISFNLAIIIGLIKSRRAIASSSNTNSHPVTFNSQIAALLSISVTFVLMSLPYPLYIIIDYDYEEKLLALDDLPFLLQALGWMGHVSDSITNSIMIVFDCIFGKKFRQCLRKLLCCNLKWPVIRCLSVSRSNQELTIETVSS